MKLLLDHEQKLDWMALEQELSDIDHLNSIDPNILFEELEFETIYY